MWFPLVLCICIDTAPLSTGEAGVEACELWPYMGGCHKSTSSTHLWCLLEMFHDKKYLRHRCAIRASIVDYERQVSYNGVGWKSGRVVADIPSDKINVFCVPSKY